MKLHQRIRALMLTLLFLAAAPASADEVTLSKGKTLYLPIYSQGHDDLKEGGHPLKALISALVSIRNMDMKHPLRVLSARHLDTGGKPLHEYIPAPKAPVVKALHADIQKYRTFSFITTARPIRTDNQGLLHI